MLGQTPPLRESNDFPGRLHHPCRSNILCVSYLILLTPLSYAEILGIIRAGAARFKTSRISATPWKVPDFNRDRVDGHGKRVPESSRWEKSAIAFSAIKLLRSSASLLQFEWQPCHHCIELRQDFAGALLANIISKVQH